MKKVIALVLIAMMAISVVACGSTTQNLLMVTGGSSGTYYAFGGIIANVLSENMSNVSITASTSGASVVNARSLQSGEADLAILQNDVLDYAYNGTEILAGETPMTNIATIATLYPEVIQIVCSVSSGISSIADLAGKRVSVGDVGSGTEANARQILAVYGLDYDDFDESFLGFADSSTGIQNGTIDAAFVTAGVPNTAIQELNATVEVRLLPVEADKAAELIAQYPFYSTYDILDTDYEGIAGVETVAILATLACRADMDEDLVYELTKALFEAQPTLAEQHAKGKVLSTENAITGVSVPFHAGAVKYYTEIGLTVG